MRDRYLIYGGPFCDRLTGMGIEEVSSAPRSPWQNPFVERLIGSVRRECLDVLGERHLRRILASPSLSPGPRAAGAAGRYALDGFKARLAHVAAPLRGPFRAGMKDAVPPPASKPPNDQRSPAKLPVPPSGTPVK